MSRIKSTKPEDGAFGFQQLSVDERLRLVQERVERINRLSELSEHHVFSTAPLLAVGIDRDPAEIYFNVADLDYEEMFKFTLPGSIDAVADLGSLGGVLQCIVKDYWDDFEKFMTHQAFVNRKKDHYWKVDLVWVEVLDPMAQNKPPIVVTPYKLAVFLPNGNKGRFVVEKTDNAPSSVRLERADPLQETIMEARKEGIGCE